MGRNGMIGRRRNFILRLRHSPQTNNHSTRSFLTIGEQRIPCSISRLIHRLLVKWQGEERGKGMRSSTTNHSIFTAHLLTFSRSSLVLLPSPPVVLPTYTCWVVQKSTSVLPSQFSNVTTQSLFATVNSEIYQPLVAVPLDSYKTEQTTARFFVNLSPRPTWSISQFSDVLKPRSTQPSTS